MPTSIYYCIFLGSLTQIVASSEKSSYIIVLEESSRLTNDTINSYAKRLKSDLQIKINNLKLNASLRSIIKDEDKLWISQSIRLDLTRTQVDEIAKNPQVQAIVEDNVIYLQEPIIEKNIDLNRQKVTYGLESLKEITKVWEKYKF